MKENEEYDLLALANDEGLDVDASVFAAAFVKARNALLRALQLESVSVERLSIEALKKSKSFLQHHISEQQLKSATKADRIEGKLKKADWSDDETPFTSTYYLPVPEEGATMEGLVLETKDGPNLLFLGQEWQQFELPGIPWKFERITLVFSTGLSKASLLEGSYFTYQASLLIPLPFKEVRLNVWTWLPFEPAPVVEFRASFDDSECEIPTLRDLAQLVGANEWTNLLPPVLQGATELGLTDFTFQLDTGARGQFWKTLKLCSATLGLNKEWKIWDDKVVLSGFEMTVESKALEDRADYDITVYLHASVHVLGATASVLFDSAAGRFGFKVTDLVLSTVLKELTAGQLTLPAFMQSFTLSECEIQHDYKQEDTSLSALIANSVKLAGQEAVFDAGFSLTHEQGATNATVSGTLKWLGFSFDLDLTLDDKTEFKASLKNANLRQIIKALSGQGLPDGMPDVTIKALELGISSEKEITLHGEVNFNKESEEALSLNEEVIPIASVTFDAKKNNSGLEIRIEATGTEFPGFGDLGMGLKQYSFQFGLNRKEGESADWQVGGELGVEAFERLLTFKAALTKNEVKRSFSFTANNKPLVTAACFDQELGMNTNDLVAWLKDSGTIDKDHLLKEGVKIDDIKLPTDLLPEADGHVRKTLKKIQKNDQPLVTIPDLLDLSINPDLCTLNPVSLELTWEKEAQKPASWKFSGIADFELFDLFNEGQKFIHLKKGRLSLYKEEKESGITFEAKDAEVQPLNWIPGFREALPLLLGELGDDRPRTEAFLKMLVLGLGATSFIKKETEWELKASAHMVLTDDLKTAHAELFDVCERFFPSLDGQRKVSGKLALSSKSGLSVTLLNDNPFFEIPNLLQHVVNDLDPELRASINEGFENSGFDTTIEELLDLGNSFVRIEQVGFKALKKEMEFKVMVAMGLPSNLNNLLFGKSGKLNGLIKTYDKAKLKPLDGEQYPDDNLMRAGLIIGTKGIGGKIEKFDLINQDKLAELVGDAIGKYYKETPESIEFDFDTLIDGVTDPKEEDRKYGRISIVKPKFNLSMEDGSFYARGGINVLSQQLKIPVRSLAKKVFSLLPLSYLRMGLAEKVIDNLIDGIPIRSVDFFKDGKLSLTDLEDWLVAMLGSEHKDLFSWPKPFKELIEEGGGAIANRLPDRFKQYMGLVLPKGIEFELNISADKSFSFHFGVDQSGNESDNFKPYLQLLLPPDPSMPIQLYGVRIRKIGFGTALGNQLLRLDLSGDLDMFNLVHLAAAVALPRPEAINNEDLKLMLPDGDKFVQTFKLRNFITLIILQTEIPIPVPLFYDQAYAAYYGLEGVEMEMDYQFSAPQFNLVKILKRFVGLINFFRNGDESLHVPTHYLAQLSGKAEYEKDLIPAFQVGPVYYTLPGYFGYELVNEGGEEQKKRITIGFKDRKVIDLMELIGTGANALKFSLFHLCNDAIPKEVPVKSALNPKKVETKAPPLNYLIQYFNLDDRVNRKHIKLFYLFDIEMAWAVCTPQEFRKEAYPKIFKEQALKNVGFSQSEESMLAILPSENHDAGKPTGLADNDQGAVLFLRGAAQVANTLGMDTALAVVVSEKLGFATAVSFRAFIANLLRVELWGMMKLNTAGDANEQFRLEGSSRIELMEVDILKGSFELSLGKEFGANIDFEGEMDLFPPTVYPSDFPMALYSTDKPGSTTRGKVKAHIDNERFFLSGGAYLSLGPFKLTGGIAVAHDLHQSKLEIDLALLDARMILKAKRVGLNFLWEGFTTPLNLGNGLIRVDAVSPRTVQHGNEQLVLGPSARIEVKNLLLESFYLDGRLDLFGLSILGKMHLKPSGFFLYSHIEAGNEQTGGVGYHFELDIDHIDFSVKGKGEAYLYLNLALNLGELGVLHLSELFAKFSMTFESVGNESKVAIYTSLQIQVANLPKLAHSIIISESIPLGTGALKGFKETIEGLVSGKSVIDQIIEGFKDPNVWKQYAEEGIVKALNGAKMVTDEIDKVLKGVFGISPKDVITTTCAATSFANNPDTRFMMMSFDEDIFLNNDDRELRGDANAQLDLIRYFRSELLKESKENPGKAGKTMGEWYVALYEELSEPMVDFFQFDGGDEGTGDFNYMTYSDERKPNGITLYKELLEILNGAKEGEEKSVSRDFWLATLDYVGDVADLAQEEYEEKYKVVWRGLTEMLKTFQGLVKHTDKPYQEIRDQVLPQLVQPYSIEELKRKLHE